MAALKLNEQAKPFTLPGVDDNYDNPGAVKDHYLRAALDAVLGAKPLSVSETQAAGCTIQWR
jgi:hypothetical protein